jgi:hypothetical protein
MDTKASAVARLESALISGKLRRLLTPCANTPLLRVKTGGALV